MNSNRTHVTFLDHTADLGITVTGTSLEDLFKNAAQSMMQIMVKQQRVGKTSPFRLSVSGEDLPDLMVCWLGEILYLFEGERKVVISVDIDSITKSHIDAMLRITPFNPKEHEILTEIKAVTYHQIKVAREKGRWQARVIFDI
ncbi:MAG: archease [Deltaproteobacteria bacterium]|nr:archease [Deltaproteobacteria bacterium]